MHLIHRIGLALLTATLALTTACGDNVAPPPPLPQFDAAEARAQTEPLVAVLDQPIVSSFTVALSSYVRILRGVSPAGAASTAPSASMPLALSRSASSLPPLAFSRSATSLAPLASLGSVTIPAAYAGETFAFDPTADAYKVDASATGAPANGVRFVLYVIDEVTGYPVEPLTPIGYLDITPAANGADGVHLVVVRDAPQLTVADLERTRTAITGGSSFRLRGRATDGTTSLDIAFDGSETGADPQRSYVYDSKVSAASLGVGMELQLNFDGPSATTTGASIVSYDRHIFTTASTPPTGSELRFDGRLYARVVYSTIPGGASEFLKPDGTPLTQAEIAGVVDLFDRVGPANLFWLNLAL